MYNDFFEPRKILNVQYHCCVNIEDEKNRNRVKLADLLTKNPEHQQELITWCILTMEKNLTTKK